MKIILFLLFIAVLVSGCIIGDGERDYAMSHFTSNATQTPLTTPAAISTQSIPIPPPIYWIKFDPISDKQVGEIFTINSTTNLSAGEEIFVQVFQTSWHTQLKSSTYEYSGFSNTVNVSPGRDGVNKISFIFNSSGFHPDEYLIVEDAIKENAKREATFNITPMKIS
jgi:hypothetical protein